ncbi:MAG: hypothetical protein JWN61_976 [Pseudonocardiales bacterium]|nr:hypothetical protein [Pseudonocardiales bacterium]
MSGSRLFRGIQYTSNVIQQSWVHNLYGHPAYLRSYVADVWQDKSAPSRK